MPAHRDQLPIWPAAVFAEARDQPARRRAAPVVRSATADRLLRILAAFGAASGPQLVDAEWSTVAGRTWGRALLKRMCRAGLLASRPAWPARGGSLLGDPARGEAGRRSPAAVPRPHARRVAAPLPAPRGVSAVA